MLDYHIYWYDDEQTILIMDVRNDDWEWKYTLQALREFFAEAETVTHPIYTVTIFRYTPPNSPPDGGLFEQVRDVMRQRPDHEVLTIFVGANSFYAAVLNVVRRMFGFRRLLGQFRFEATLEAALAEIDAEKARRSATVSESSPANPQSVDSD